MGRAEDIFHKLSALEEDAIDEFILTRQTEELYLDFKRANHPCPLLLQCLDAILVKLTVFSNIILVNHA